VLRGVPLAERQIREDLVIVVERGAELRIGTKNESEDRAEVEVLWEGLLLGNWHDRDESRVVPPGNVLVRWTRRSIDGTTRIDHEEQHTVEAGQELAVEWAIR
jgi:hypothetical protein